MKKVLVAVMASVVMFAMIGCTPVTSIGGGQTNSHGLLSSFGSAAQAAGGDSEIGTYTTWLGLFDSGFSDYASAVKQAHADGKVITSTNTWFVFFTKTTAYAK
jgi:hypothetical protein